MAKNVLPNLKIGFDAKRLFNNFSGLGDYSRSLVKALQFHYPENEYYLYSPKIIENEQTLYFLDDSKFQIRTCDHLWPGFRPLRSLYRIFWQNLGLNKQLKKDGIQVFYGLSQQFPVFFPSKRVKSVVTVHDFIPGQFPKDYSWFDRQITAWKTRQAIRIADLVVFISKQTREYALRKFPEAAEKSSVIYPPVDLSWYDMINPDECPATTLPRDYLLFIGANQLRKNLISTIEALATLGENNNIPLVVTGYISPRLKKIYTRKIRTLKIRERIVFTGQIPEELLQRLYIHAKAVIYPSNFEGFGIPAYTALALGVPLVASEKLPVWEIADSSKSVLLKDRNGAELKTAIRKVFELKKHDRTVFLKEMDPVFIAGKFIALFKTLLGN